MKETMAGNVESFGWGPEQPIGSEIAPQTNEAGHRLAALRDRAIKGAREGFVGSVESGLAEEVAKRAIDVAASTAKTSLNGLPPGTRLVGKYFGRKAIERLQESANRGLGNTLGQAADRMTAPVFPDYSQPAPASGWVPAEATSSYPQSPDTAQGYGGFVPKAASATPEQSWWNAPDVQAVAEIPAEKQRGLFRRRD